MAEEVQISNVGGDGVASEVTLARLVTAMEAMAKKSGIDSKSQAAKLQALYNKEVTTATKSTAEATSARKENTEAVKNATTETNRFARSLGGAVASGLGALVTSTIGLGKAFWNNTTSVEEFASLLPGIGSLLGPLGAVVDESVSSFRNLSSAGAAFGGSITNMRNAAAEMEISLSEMTNLFTEQAPALASLGGTVEEGAARFARMNKNIKATGDFRSLMEMGFSVEQVNEGMADYITLQARQGRLQGQSTEQLAEGSAGYLRQIDLLARVTGKTREEAQRALDAQATDSIARTLLNQFEAGSTEYNNLSSSLALLDEVGGEAATALKGMLTENLTPAAGRFKAMLGDSGETVHRAMMQVGQGADPQVLLDAFATAGGELERFAGADAAGRVAIIQALRDAGDPMAEYLDGAARLIDLGNRDMAAAQAQQAAQRAQQDEASRAMLTFEQNQRELSAALHKTFVASGILDLIGSGLQSMGTLLTGIATSLTEFSTKVANGQWFEAITDLLGDALGGLWENKGIVGAIVAGLTALFAAKAATSALSSAVGGFFTRMFTGGSARTPQAPNAPAPSGGAGGGRGIGGGIGKSIGDFGRGLGKGIGGILRGLAGGIAAFANPAVPIGAAALGAAIVAIGAGIAGATWIMGAALPKFAEGMQSFEDLDGAKLISAGKGMAAVAGGMAAFGAGSAIAGLGGLVGAVTEGIAGLFGAEDPLEKIKRFQDYNFDEAKITANSNSIVAYSKAMAALGGAGAIQGIGAAVGAVGGAIASLFGGGGNPLDNLLKFEAYNFNQAKIEANALAVKAYAEAMKDFPQAPTTSLMSSFRTGVASLLGGETDPMAPIKRFGELTFNTAGIIANAGAVAAYAEAIRDFPESPATSIMNSFRQGVASLLGGETDPMAPVKRFGDMTLNTAGIIANAGAVAAYAEAMRDFPASPSASVFTAAKDAIIELLGGNTDPFAPMKAFGDLTFNTAGIIANAGAVAAYAEAMRDFPTIPSVSIFTAAKNAIIELLGGNTDPFAPMKAFGEMTFNTQGIIANAGAVAAYAEAMKDFPESPSASLFESFKNGLLSLFGGNTDPFAPMKAFGDMTFNTQGIITNASAVQNFSNAMKLFAESGISDLDIPGNLSSRLSSLNDVEHQNFQSLANGLNALGNVQGLQSNLEILKNNLDAASVTRYADAIEDLVEKLEDLNSELSKDNNGRRSGTGTNAGDVIGQFGSATTGTNESTQQLNNTMQQILAILTEMRDINEDIEQNTGNMVGSNIAQGGVSVIPR